MIPAMQEPGTCPCGYVKCMLWGTKIAKVSGHLVGCTCSSCRNRNNQKRGKRGEARRHQRLGGTGFTPKDDLMHLYSLNVATEDKVGQQVPRKFAAFAESETARHWWAQAEKKIPVGSDAFPTLYLELSPKKWFLVVKGEGRSLR